ncbi:MAG: hypothetical protein WD066_17350 [Planctomycetaceae bacterium]
MSEQKLRPASHVAADLALRESDALALEAARIIRDLEETIAKLSRVVSQLVAGPPSRN